MNQPLLRTSSTIKAFLRSEPGTVLYFHRITSGTRGETWSGPVREDKITSVFQGYAAFRQMKPLYRVKVTRKGTTA